MTFIRYKDQRFEIPYQISGKDITEVIPNLSKLEKIGNEYIIPDKKTFKRIMGHKPSTEGLQGARGTPDNEAYLKRHNLIKKLR